MEKVDFSFTTSKEAQLEKEAVEKELMASSIVQEWLQNNDLPTSLVQKHTYKIKDYVEAKQKCSGCAGLAACMQPTTGYVLELEYDGALSKVARPCIYQQKQNELLKHKAQFSLCDMSDEQLGFSFDKIVLDNEKAAYIALLDEMEEATQRGHKGFYLCGEPGTGKTYLACCFVNAMAKQGKRCAFVNVSHYLSMLKASMQDKEAYASYIQALHRADVVVFDDIAGESASNYTRDEILLPILNERMEKKLMTLFTSNYDMDNLLKFYALNSKMMNDEVGAKRLVERMKALSLQKQVNGINRRLKKE